MILIKYFWHMYLLVIFTLSTAFSCAKQPPLTDSTVTEFKANNYVQEQIPQELTLKKILAWYGYTTDTQIASLEFLLIKSGIITPESSLNNLFPQRTNNEELLADLATFIEQTQQHFTIRRGTQERWEIQNAYWMNDIDCRELEQHLTNLGVISPVLPNHTTPQAVCILGSTNHGMQIRTNFAHTIVPNFPSIEQIIMLVGERKVTIGIDGTEQELLAIADSFGMRTLGTLTETHLAQKIIMEHPFASHLSIEIIDTPANNLPRPTTETTIAELTDWLKKSPTIQSILFVSNQPYVAYQKAIIEAVLAQKKCDIQYEVIGSAAANPELEHIHTIIGSVGSFLWAKTPMILANNQLKITTAELQERYKNLYQKNPVLSEIINKLTTF